MDLDKTVSLLNIVDLTRDQPTLRPLLDRALKELAKAAYEVQKEDEAEAAKAEQAPKAEARRV